MIVTERRVKTKNDQSNHFGEAMQDGRLTEMSLNKVYRLREAILHSKRLGRPLTAEEMEKYEVR